MTVAEMQEYIDRAIQNRTWRIDDKYVCGFCRRRFSSVYVCRKHLRRCHLQSIYVDAMRMEDAESKGLEYIPKRPDLDRPTKLDLPVHHSKPKVANCPLCDAGIPRRKV